jgi:ribonuclease D
MHGEDQLESSQPIVPVTDAGELERLCAELAKAPFVAVDTEFMRESTYWPRLCLVQVGSPELSAVIDPLAPGIGLAPFFRLMADECVLKVFHAARQDIEIVWYLAGLIPHPVFDTQVAGMVCGFGDSISYDQLVQRLTGARIDKSSRFTDWSRRPLSQKQLHYALSDVVHLAEVYPKLAGELERRGRTEWVQEEMDVLTSPETYRMEPEHAWRRLKMRVRRPRELAVLMTVAQWREREAQARDVPRSRVLKDDALFELAQQRPQTSEELAQLRALPRGFERSRHGAELLETVRLGLEMDLATVPRLDRTPASAEPTGAITDLFKVLLKAVSEQEGVAARVIATVDDLSRMAVDDKADVPALKGWRRQLFGEAALRLKRGELGLAVENGRVTLLEPKRSPT